MFISNSTELTVTQEDKIIQLALNLFEEKITTDFWHFSFEGTRLNLDSKKMECCFEAHSDKGSFDLFIDLNENKQGLKRTFKAIKK